MKLPICSFFGLNVMCYMCFCSPLLGEESSVAQFASFVTNRPSIESITFSQLINTNSGMDSSKELFWGKWDRGGFLLRRIDSIADASTPISSNTVFFAGRHEGRAWHGINGALFFADDSKNSADNGIDGYTKNASRMLESVLNFGLRDLDNPTLEIGPKGFTAKLRETKKKVEGQFEFAADGKISKIELKIEGIPNTVNLYYDYSNNASVFSYFPTSIRRVVKRGQEILSDKKVYEILEMTVTTGRVNNLSPQAYLNVGGRDETRVLELAGRRYFQHTTNGVAAVSTSSPLPLPFKSSLYLLLVVGSFLIFPLLLWRRGTRRTSPPQ